MKIDPIIQWNCRGLRANFAELQQILVTLNPIAVCLQETQLVPGTSPSFKGFTIYHCHGPNTLRPSGGTAILVRSHVPHCHIAVNSTLQATAVRISNVLERAITLCSLYIPPTSKLMLNELCGLVEQLSSPYILLGDFNGHNPIWGTHPINAKGKVLELFIGNNDLCLLNTPSHTYLHPGHGTYSTIDLTLCSPELLLDFSWEVWTDLCGSDHFPIVVTPVRPLLQQKAQKWKLKKADWPTFQARCWESLCVAPTQHGVCMEWFTDTLRSIADETIPKSSSRSCKRRNPWFDEHCKQAVYDRKRSERVFNKHPTTENLIQLKISRAKARRVIRSAKTLSWQDFVSKLTKTTPPAKVWNLVRKMKNKGDNMQTQYIKQLGRVATSETDIANLLAEAFEKNSGGHNSLPEFQIIRPQMELRGLNFLSDNSEPYNKDFSLEELQISLSKSSDTATGPDQIHYQFLKHLPQEALTLLLTAYNQVWKSGQIPPSWKEAIVIPIPKPGKDHSDPNNYRPIALTSCLCKTMERMINNRLVWQLETNRALTEMQSGFRKGRSTTDNLVRLESFVRNAFIRKEHAVTVFFDLEKAYDTTWRYGIQRDLFCLGFRGRLPLFISNFLTDRFFRVRVNNTYSNRHTQEMGVPQGSILSVTLFSLKINSVVNVVPPGIFFSLYVDDLCIGFQGKNMNTVVQRLQLGINKIYQWSIVNGFKISKTKTKGLHFCQLRTMHPEPVLYLDGRQLDFVQEVKFLGLTLDKKLTFIPHLKDLKLKCLKLLDLLKVLANTRWGADFPSLLRVYRALIRSRMDYGSIVYGATRKSYLKALNTVHLQGIRLALGAFRTSPALSLYVEACEPSLDDRRLILALQYVIKLKANSRNAAYASVFSPSYVHLYEAKPKHIQPFGLRIRSHLQNVNIDLNSIGYLYPAAIPPWSLRKLTIIMDLSRNLKSSTHPLIYRQKFADVRAMFPRHIPVYTDGSKTDKQVSAAMVDGQQTTGVVLPRHCSVFTAEAYALLLALDHAQTTGRRKVLVCTDSKSCLQAMSALDLDHPIIVAVLQKAYQLHSSKYDVVFCWIPGHCGLMGNELADQAAKTATALMATVCKAPPTDARPLLISYVMNRWQTEWDRQTSNKLHEIHPNIRCRLTRNFENRWNQVVYTRCRIGHTRLTHSFLLKGEEPPHCDACRTPLSVKHLLLDCTLYHQDRCQLRLPSAIKDIFTKTNPGTLLKFLLLTGLKAYI